MVDRMPRAQALTIAQEVVEALVPIARRVQVAGSLRRRQPTVKDVEILFEPLVVDYRLGNQYTLLGSDTPRSQPAASGLTQVLRELKRAHGIELVRNPTTGRPRANGTRYKRLWTRIGFLPVPIDLYVVMPPASWGAQLAIRTGPAGFSKLLVTRRSDGGARPNHLVQRDGALWHGGQRLDHDEEEDYFAALGLPYWPPAERTDARLRRHLMGRPIPSPDKEVRHARAESQAR